MYKLIYNYRVVSSNIGDIAIGKSAEALIKERVPNVQFKTIPWGLHSLRG